MRPYHSPFACRFQHNIIGFIYSPDLWENRENIQNRRLFIHFPDPPATARHFLNSRIICLVRERNRDMDKRSSGYKSQNNQEALTPKRSPGPSVSPFHSLLFPPVYISIKKIPLKRRTSVRRKRYVVYVKTSAKVLVSRLPHLLPLFRKWLTRFRFQVQIFVR